jgi:hypothetical protein
MTWGATAIAGASLVGSVVSSQAAKSAAGTQAKASKEAIAQQYAASQAAIANQQQVLDAQIRNAGGVQTAQTQQLQDQLDQQLRVAAETRDAQIAQSRMTKEEQLAFAGKTKDEQMLIAREVLGKQEGAYDPYQQAGLEGQNRLREYLGIGGDTRAKGYGQYANAQFTPEAFAANQDPGYGFRMKEGLKAVDAQAAARGGLISGAALKASQRFGQDMASQEYQNAFNRYQTSRQATLGSYQGLQGVGMQAAGGLSNAAGGFGQTGFNSLANYGGTGERAIGTAGSQAIGAYGGYGAAASNAYGALGSGLYNTTGTAGGMINSAYGNYGNQVTGALTGFGTNQANLTTGAANAQAAGTVGQANAFNQGISGASNAYYQNQMLNLFRDRNPSSVSNLNRQYGSNNVYGAGAANYQPSIPTSGYFSSE